MSSTDLTAELLSREPLLAVEAAAGAGKTHQAAVVAAEVTRQLEPWQRVLFLSHTNSARNEISTRVGGASRQIITRTLDAFALELLSPYAKQFGLPAPLRPPIRGRDAGAWFEEARASALRLVTYAPAVARAVVARFPFIIADEHQDASSTQHQILCALNANGARLRLFGDALQGILTFAKDVPGWNVLVGNAPVLTLDGTWRWASNPPLGLWIQHVRRHLIAKEPIDLGMAPDCVSVVRVSRGGLDLQTITRTIGMARASEPCVVLVRKNLDAEQLASQMDLSLSLFEGASLSSVDEFLNGALESAGDASGQASALLRFARQTGRGMTAAVGRAIETVAKSVDGVASVVPDAALAIGGPIARDPTLSGAVLALRALVRCGAECGWEPHSHKAVRIMTDLPTGSATEDLRDTVYRAQRALEAQSVPDRCVTTIHKAKGRQFPHAVVARVGAGDFRMTQEDRNLLYVALSRPVERLSLLVPDHPSPLLRL